MTVQPLTLLALSACFVFFVVGLRMAFGSSPASAGALIAMPVAVSTTEKLTQAERDACDAMLGALASAALNKGLNPIGIDSPSGAIHEAISAWLVAAREDRRDATNL